MKQLAKVSLRNGVLAAIIGCGLLMGLYYMDRHPFLIPVYIDFRIILFGVFIVFTLREIRDYYQGGMLYFSHGILASFNRCLRFRRGCACVPQSVHRPLDSAIEIASR